MKKLVAVTTTILIILIAVLGLMVVKGSTGTDSSSPKTALSDLKERKARATRWCAPASVIC